MLPIGAQRFSPAEPVSLEWGGRLQAVDIAYETWGELSSRADNAVLVCPSFSGHSHAASHAGDPSPGWWEGMIGPGLALDTDRFFVVCTSLLGASYGSTGPRSVDPASGEAYGPTFPIVSVRDLVDLQVALVDSLGIERLYGAIGGSLGAMEALELAVRHPRRVERVFAISGTDRTRPFTAAVRHLGRRAILLDRSADAAGETGGGSLAGLTLAREIGMVFYRSREEFNQRFRWQPIQPPSLDEPTFDVQSYLRHQGNKILGDFDPDSYLILSLAMDLFDVWRGFPSREAALEPVEARFTVVGVDEDRLIPIDEQEWLHHALVTAGKRSHWRAISSRVGHDTFLVEIDRMTELVRDWLET